jgi:hypothetical protein
MIRSMMNRCTPRSSLAAGDSRAASVLDSLEQVRTNEPIRPSRFQPNVPPDMATICLKCLQKDAAKRYATAANLSEDLRRFGPGEPIMARPVGRSERFWRWCRRNPRIAALSWAGSPTPRSHSWREPDPPIPRKRARAKDGFQRLREIDEPPDFVPSSDAGTPS